MQKLTRTAVIGMVLFFLAGCGYNDLQGLDENVKAAWSEVQNQYQRRADLIPNLVNVVKGYAAHERETLEAVTEARAKVGSVQVTPQTLNDPQSFKQFEEAQAGLTSALSRLMVVVEKYPDLKANQNFLDLQSQLEGTENRITVARKRYIDSVNEYNKMVRYFPTNLTARFILHLDVRPNFTATTPGAEKPPEVKF
jgi:LemA protein